MTNRAVSTTLSYAMSLAMITLLVTGVFIATSDFVENERDRTIRSEVNVLGNRVAADIATVDRLAVADPEGTATLRTNLPGSVAGKAYQITITSPAAGPTSITLATGSEPFVQETVTVKTEQAVVNTTLAGGPIEVTYNGTVVEVHRA